MAHVRMCVCILCSSAVASRCDVTLFCALCAGLTPELHPFFAGTYFPPGRFRGVLSKLAEVCVSSRRSSWICLRSDYAPYADGKTTPSAAALRANRSSSSSAKRQRYAPSLILRRIYAHFDDTRRTPLLRAPRTCPSPRWRTRRTPGSRASSTA